jgi:hypothetical protein
MRTFFAILLLVAAAAAQQPPASAAHVVEVFHEFERIGAQPLWPGFEPTKTAVEVYDGTNTYLYHHPKPPEGFTPVAGAPGVFMFPGQHDSVRANTGTELNGVPTATADISKSKTTTREQAALLIHETFHVYEKKAHPKWAANEAELFTYPMENAEILTLRRLETRALVDALAAFSDERQVRCLAELALDIRQRRFSTISAGAAGYERGIELNEGLAQYVEYLSIKKGDPLEHVDFPVELVRQRAYATGQAWALLLDRFQSDWKTNLVGTSLDEALRRYLTTHPWNLTWRCDYGAKTVHDRQLILAKREIAALIAARAQRKQAFLSAPGWRIEIIAGKEPLWPQGFDPWNVQNLGNNDILHTRWAKLGNATGAIEALDHPSLTEGVGPHPLFNGAKRYIITGLIAPPSINEKDGKVTIDAPGAKGTFTGASVTTTGQTVVVRLP